MVVRLALVDDHPVVLAGLQGALSTVSGFKVVACGTTIAEARAILERRDVDVVLLDVRFPDGNALEVLATGRRSGRPAVIVLSSFTSRQYIAAAIRFGAHGFILKTAPIQEIITAVHRESAGESSFTSDQMRDGRGAFVDLTSREREILRLVLQGKSNDEIAMSLGLSRKTVEVHLSQMYQRFELSGRVELALKADHEGWLEIGAGRAARVGSSGGTSRQRHRLLPRHRVRLQRARQPEGATQLTATIATTRSRAPGAEVIDDRS